MLSGVPGPDWPEERLVAYCLDGSEPAWNALVDKYKNLVWAIILRYGIPTDQAADLFQSVWLDVYNDLGQLRKRDAVKPWLSSVVRNKCFHWKKRSSRRQHFEGSDQEPADLADDLTEDPTFVEDLERHQLVREAISSLSERCREMVGLLFFHEPPLPYKEVAGKLGLAVGSIGFIRGRCLDKLQRALKDLGLGESDDIDAL